MLTHAVSDDTSISEPTMHARGCEGIQHFAIVEFINSFLSADSSNELSDPDITQHTDPCQWGEPYSGHWVSINKLGARFSGHWVATSMFA